MIQLISQAMKPLDCAQIKAAKSITSILFNSVKQRWECFAKLIAVSSSDFNSGYALGQLDECLHR